MTTGLEGQLYDYIFSNVPQAKKTNVAHLSWGTEITAVQLPEDIQVQPCRTHSQPQYVSSGVFWCETLPKVTRGQNLIYKHEVIPTLTVKFKLKFKALTS